MGLQDDQNDPEQHKRVAERVFHNHDVTNAKGLHIAKQASKQQNASCDTLALA